MNISGLSGGGNGYSLQTRSVNQSDQAEMAKKLASAMLEDLDSSGDGSLTSREIGVEQSLLTRADTDGDGKLSESELIGLMNQAGPPPPPDGAMGAAGNSAAAGAGQGPGDMFSQLDANGDGALSEEEFLAGRPEDVSEYQAKQMWGRLDGAGGGSLSESDFQSAMASQGPPPGPPPGGGPGSQGTSADPTAATEASGASSQDLASLLASLLSNYGLSRYRQSMDGSLMGLLGGGQEQGSSGISLTA